MLDLPAPPPALYAPAPVTAAPQGAHLQDHAPHRYRRAVVYQIYWRRFADSDGDGIGDARGIIAHLPYLAALKVTDLWITPMFPSPMVDGGYDVADYCAVDPRFGSMADFEDLVAAARRLGLNIMLDMVFNHVSERHPWFVAAERDPNGPYRDYFIWADAQPDGGPPDGRMASFGGSAWRFVPAAGQYVLHSFTEAQIDLNWENPRVRAELAAVLKFWLARGVRGFRFDVIDLIDKSDDQSRLTGYLAEMHAAALDRDDLVTVGEMVHVHADSAARYTHPEAQGLNMVFSFEFPGLTSLPTSKWTPRSPAPAEIRNHFARWQLLVAQGGGWNSLYTGNHDWPRVVSRFGTDATQALRQASATLWATLLLTHQGTPFIYQGEELGLPNTVYPTIEGYEDVESRNFYREATERGMDRDDVLRRVQQGSRDASRAPMPWTGPGPLTVEGQEQQAHAVLHTWRHLLHLRQASPLWIEGAYRLHPAEADAAYVYSRGDVLGAHHVVIANLTPRAVHMGWPASLRAKSDYRRIFSNHPTSGSAEPAGELNLMPLEARIYGALPD